MSSADLDDGPKLMKRSFSANFPNCIRTGIMRLLGNPSATRCKFHISHTTAGNVRFTTTCLKKRISLILWYNGITRIFFPSWARKKGRRTVSTKWQPCRPLYRCLEPLVPFEGSRAKNAWENDPECCNRFGTEGWKCNFNWMRVGFLQPLKEGAEMEKGAEFRAAGKIAM